MLTLSKKYENLFKRPYATEGSELAEVDTFILTGGRFSAKSFTTSLAVSTWTRDFDFKTLYTRYTMTSAKDSVIPEFIDNLEILNTQHEFTAKIDRVEHETGGEVVFKGIKTSSGNQTANLKSLKGFNVFVLDEAEESQSKKEFQKISLSIRHNERPNIKILILNPTTREHWIYQEYFEGRNVSGGFNGIKDNVCYIHTSYLDCIEHVPENIIQEFERIKINNPKEYNHIVLGGWLEKAEGVIFENWEEGEFDKSLPNVFGQDYGFAVEGDPTTLVDVAVCKRKKEIYVRECLYKNNLSTDEIAVFNKQHAKHKLIVGDCAEPRLISELKKKRNNIIGCIKGPDSIRSGIKSMQSYKIIVDPDSHNIKKELNNYIWNDKKSDTPVDEYNHAIDAIRYAFTYLTKPQRRGYDYSQN